MTSQAFIAGAAPGGGDNDVVAISPPSPAVPSHRSVAMTRALLQSPRKRVRDQQQLARHVSAMMVRKHGISHKLRQMAGRARAATELKHEQKYTFAIVLRNPASFPDGPAKFWLRRMQESILVNLLSMHLDLLLLEESELSTGKIVVLVSAMGTPGDPERYRLLHELKHLVHVERFLASMGEGAPPEPPDPAGPWPEPSFAMQVYLTHELIERALDVVRLDDRYITSMSVMRDVLHPDGQQGCHACGPGEFEPIQDRFALHNQKFNDDLMKSLWNRFHVPADDKRPLPDVFKKVDHFMNVSKEVNMIFQHYGPRVAFYFAFVNAYTRALLPLAAFVVPYYLIFRIASWAWYVRTLALVGMAVPLFWATVWMKRWANIQDELAYDWQLEKLPVDDHVRNKDSNGNVVTGVLKTDAERGVVWTDYDPHRRRLKVTLCMFPFALINILILFIVLTPFQQWYAYGKLSPTCDCCNWYMNATATERTAYSGECERYLVNMGKLGYKDPASCTYFITCFNSFGGTVGTDRWVYILIQGIILGIFLDVVQDAIFRSFTEWLTHIERWPYTLQFETHLIRKRFAFLWGNMYMCFMFVAFAGTCTAGYVPFGHYIQEFLIQLGLDIAVPGHGWRNGVIHIDEAFVTPLIVTQSLNLAIETFVPWLCARGRVKAAQLQRRTHLHDAMHVGAATIHALSHAGKVVERDFVAVGRAAKTFTHRASVALHSGLTPSKRRGDDSTGDDDAGSGAGAGASGQGGSGGADQMWASASERSDGFAGVAPSPTGVVLAEPGAGMVAIDVTEAKNADDDRGVPGTGVGMSGRHTTGGGDDPDSNDPTPLVNPGRVAPSGVRRSNSFSAAAQVNALILSDTPTDAEVHQCRELHTPETLREAVLQEWASQQVVHAGGARPDPHIVVAASSGDINMYDGDAIMKEMDKSDFHPREDYLDMLMQFGYVCMFTTCWALAPVPAFLNNILELRGDVFKLIYNSRRPVPAWDRGIGEWERMFNRSAQWSVPIVVALIFITTGEAEFWVFDACSVPSQVTEIMGPNLACFSDWGIRLAFAVVLEHILLAIQEWVRRKRMVNTSLEHKQLKEKRQRQRNLTECLPGLDPEFERVLHIVFKWFDIDDDKALSIDETQRMFSVLAAYADAEHQASAAPEATQQQLNPRNEQHKRIAIKKLVDILDKDHSASVSFAEVAFAIRHANVDPYLTLLFSSEQLVASCTKLADALESGRVVARESNIATLRASPAASDAELDFRTNAAKQLLLFDKATPNHGSAQGLRQRHSRNTGQAPGDEEAKGNAPDNIGSGAAL